MKVDQSLPLDGLITRDEELIKMLHGLNAKKWVFTNAYRPVSSLKNLIYKLINVYMYNSMPLDVLNYWV